MLAGLAKTVAGLADTGPSCFGQSAPIDALEAQLTKAGISPT
jgi:hypothetical protein